MQREPAAGDDIRQTAVLLQKLVKIQIVVADDELDIHIRQLRLDIGRIVFVQAGGPQIHLNGLGILLLLYLFCAFVPHPVSRETAITSAISTENTRCNVLLFIKSFSSQLLGSCRPALPNTAKRHRYSTTEI